MRRRRRWVQRALGVKRRRLGRGRRHRKAVRKVAVHSGLLHRQLGIPVGEKIPAKVLRDVIDQARQVAKSGVRHWQGHSPLWWQKFGQRAQFALTARKFKHKKRSGR